MKQSTAIKIAIECIKKEARRYAPEANTYMMTKTPSLKNAYDKYLDLGKAISILEGIKAQGRLF